MSKYLTEADIIEAISWRHHLHTIPELGFEEHETAKFIAEKLRLWRFEVRTAYAKTGIIGSLKRGTSQRSIGIRADIDALPILEKSGVEYASKTDGRMHACGHDGHVSTALAAAKAVSQLDFDGTVHFIFQPAEENEGGGREMVKAGLFEDFPVDAIYGMHNWPSLDVGTCVARDAEMMAAFGIFEITITGRGDDFACRVAGDAALVMFAQCIQPVGMLVRLGQRVVHRRQRAARFDGSQAGGLDCQQIVLRRARRGAKADKARQVRIQAMPARAEHHHRAVAQHFLRRGGVTVARQARGAGSQYQRRLDATLPQRCSARTGQFEFGPFGTRPAQYFRHRFGSFAAQDAVALLLGCAQHQAARAQRRRQGQFAMLRTVRQHGSVIGQF